MNLVQKVKLSGLTLVGLAALTIAACTGTVQSTTPTIAPTPTSYQAATPTATSGLGSISDRSSYSVSFKTQTGQNPPTYDHLTFITKFYPDIEDGRRANAMIFDAAAERVYSVVGSCAGDVTSVQISPPIGQGGSYVPVIDKTIVQEQGNRFKAMVKAAGLQPDCSLQK